MSKTFKLVSSFKPSGDQPEAIRRLEEELEDVLAHQTVLGVTGSGGDLYLGEYDSGSEPSHHGAGAE